MASVALAAAVITGLVGLGLGFRLGQWSAPSRLDPTPTIVETTAPAASPPNDLQPASVSARLQQAYFASSTSRWAICVLEASVVCRPLIVSVSRNPVWHHTMTFRNVEAVPPGSPAVEGGRLALAARLGDGDVTGSLIRLDPAPNESRSRGLRPLDPDGSGIDYFDLGELGQGTYALVIGHLPRSQIGAASAVVESYLTGFVVKG
jgi:hypothetical protein